MGKVLPGKPYYENYGGVNLISGAGNLRNYDWANAQNVNINRAGSVGSRDGTALVAKSYPLINDVAAYWRMEALTGTRMDYTRGEQDLGVIVGTPLRVAGYFDGTTTFQFGIDVNGGGCQRTATSSLSLDAQDWTIAFYYQKINTGVGGIIAKLNTPAAPIGGWEILDQSGIIEAHIVNSVPAEIKVSSTTNFTTATGWHLVVVTYSDTTKDLKIYVDGTLEATNTAAGAWVSFTGDIRLGLDRTGAANGKGHIDEVLVLNDELAAGIITTIWNAGVGNGIRTYAETAIAKTIRGLFQYKPSNAANPDIEYAVGGGRVMYHRTIEPAFITLPLPSNFVGDINGSDKWSFAQAFDRIYMGNGIQRNLRIESNVLFTQGLDEIGSTTPVSATAVTDGSGLLTNDNSTFYYYRVVPVRIVGGGRTIVGRPSTADIGDSLGDVALNAPNDSYDVVMPGAPADPGQTHWGLYRFWDTTSPPDQFARPASNFFFVADVPIATGTHRDLRSDADVQATQDNLDDYFEFRQLPPCQYRVTSAIAAEGQMLQSGNVLDPTSCYPSSPIFPDMGIINAYFYPGRDDGDPVQQLTAFYSSFIIFKEDRFWMAVPDSEFLSVGQVPVQADFPFRVVEVNRNLGLHAPWSVAVLPDRILFLSDKGFYEITSVDAFGRVKLQNASARIEPEILKWPTSRLKNAHAMNLRRPLEGNYRIAVSPAGAGTNTKMWIYDYEQRTPDPLGRTRSGAWHPWVGFNAEYLASIEVNDREEAWFGDNLGNIVKMDTGRSEYDPTTEAQVAISSFLDTRHYDHDLLGVTKRWRELSMEGFTIIAPIQLSWKRDFGSRPGSSKSVALDLGGGGATGLIYGTGAYGTEPYFGSSETESVTVRAKLAKATGNRIQFRIAQGTLNAAWLLHGWTLRGVVIPSLRTKRV